MAEPQKQGDIETGETREESRSMAMVSNALAIIGFIILIVIVVWGLVHIASLSTGSLGSLFSSTPKVEVTAPKNGTSGQPVGISWKYTGKEVGTYAFLYQCQQNFQFITNVTGSQAVVTKIPCGTAINVGSSTAATVIPVSTATNALPVPITVVFTSQDGKTHAEGSASISIAPGTNTNTPPIATTTPPTPKQTKPTATTSYGKPSYSTHTPLALVAHAASGPADLQVRLITVGVMDPSGALINRAPASPYDIVGIEFDIANVGGSPTGSWSFSASLPTGGGEYPYQSPTQISLAPGEHIVNTLRFSPNMRSGVITVTADPAGVVPEANKGNNVISQPL
jgi:hypothetical protein